ncbi:uncharacterized protein METZ01_LOCUS163614, partial [marine metagenome]
EVADTDSIGILRIFSGFFIKRM